MKSHISLDKFKIEFEVTFSVFVKALTDTFYNQDSKGVEERIKKLKDQDAIEILTNALMCRGTFGQNLKDDFQDENLMKHYIHLQNCVEHWVRNYSSIKLKNN